MATRPLHHQRGVTLLIALVMLTILTVFVAAMIRLSSTNVLIAGNMAVQRALRDTVQQAIETDLNSTTFYSDAANGTGWWAGSATQHTIGTADGGSNGYTVVVNKPHCLESQAAAGYSALSSTTALEDTYWEVTATGTDPTSGASVTLTQGVKITLPTGNCTV